jgi:hypothetical protein
MRSRLIFILTINLLLTACTASRVYIKTYDGPALPKSEEALLKPTLEAQIRSINGDTKYAMRTVRPGLPNIDADISLKPGRHVIVLGFRSGGIYSKGDQTVTLDALPGHKYLLKAVQFGDIWKAVIEDVTDQPEKWCWYEPECAKHGPSAPIPDSERK